MYPQVTYEEPEGEAPAGSRISLDLPTPQLDLPTPQVQFSESRDPPEPELEMPALEPILTALESVPSDPPAPTFMMTQQVVHHDIGTPTLIVKSRHHCCVCQAKFTVGENICRLYEDHRFHEQ